MAFKVNLDELILKVIPWIVCHPLYASKPNIQIMDLIELSANASHLPAERPQKKWEDTVANQRS